MTKRVRVVAEGHPLSVQMEQAMSAAMEALEQHLPFLVRLSLMRVVAVAQVMERQGVAALEVVALAQNTTQMPGLLVLQIQAEVVEVDKTGRAGQVQAQAAQAS